MCAVLLPIIVQCIWRGEVRCVSRLTGWGRCVEGVLLVRPSNPCKHGKTDVKLYDWLIDWCMPVMIKNNNKIKSFRFKKNFSLVRLLNSLVQFRLFWLHTYRCTHTGVHLYVCVSVSDVRYISVSVCMYSCCTVHTCVHYSVHLCTLLYQCTPVRCVWTVYIPKLPTSIVWVVYIITAWATPMAFLTFLRLATAPASMVTLNETITN